MQDAIRLISQAATMALIVVATRWLFNTKGASLPTVRKGASVYVIKRQWRAIGLAGAIFFVVLAIWSWHDEHRPDWAMIGMAITVSAAGLWLASGSVITDRSAITRKALWRSRTVHWSKITEIRLHKKGGGGIELRAGSEKLVIDFRIVAFEHLL